MPTLEQLRDVSDFSQRWTQPVRRQPWPDALDKYLSKSMMQQAQAEILSWSDYAETDLVNLDKLAISASVASVQYKDESTRLGLGSFKALGGAYAVLHFLATHLSEQNASPVSMSDIRAGKFVSQAQQITVASATDGNHGRSVAWGAQQAGCQCKIYIHKEVSQSRADAIAQFGADVIRVNGDYDDSLRECAANAASAGWQVISDTSYEGYMDIPCQVMAGYSVMVNEILAQTNVLPTHVIIQAGVGGLAAAVSAAFWSTLGERSPRIIIAESELAACVWQSMRTGAASSVTVSKESVMAGLSCGEISIIAWEILSRCTSAVVTLPDAAVATAMQVLAAGGAGGGKLEAGECATPGIIALLAIRKDAELSSQLALDQQSHVLVFGCEGATSPELYAQLIAGDA